MAIDVKLLYEINQSILDRKYWVMYLHPAPIDRINIRQLQGLVSKGVDKKFTQFVKQQVKAYMADGKAPDAAIAATIMNFSDDLAAGREITVRTGDYIVLQNYMQKTAKAK